jgi:hypothetical protein
MNELAKIGYAEYAAAERRFMRSPEEWENLPLTVRESFGAFTSAVVTRAIAATRLHDGDDDEEAGCGCPCHSATLSGICGTCCDGAQPSPDGGLWLQISFLGHVERIGYVTEITLGGQPAFHVDLPEKLWGANPDAWEEYAATALYSRRPLSEESVRKQWEARLERARRIAEQEARYARGQQARALEAGTADRDDQDDDQDDLTGAALYADDDDDTPGPAF